MLQIPLPAGDFGGLIFTSPLAPRILAQRSLVEKISQLPVYCVGEYSAHRASEAGFQKIRETGNDAKSLALLLEKSRISNFLYPCAKDRSYDFRAHLSGFEKSCTNWQIYSNNLLVPDQGELVAALNATNTVFLFSKRSAGHFFDVMDTPSGHLALSNHVFIAISQNVAATVPRKFLSNTYIANDKNQASMIECLQAISSKH